jgi:PRTRC genetic system protein E
MGFFKELSEIADGITLTIRIQQKNGSMAVSVIPDGVDKIRPLITNGTPEWMDENFIGAIKAPVEHVKGVILNADAFKDASVPKTMKEAAAETKKKADKTIEKNAAKADKAAIEETEETKPEAKKEKGTERKVTEKKAPVKTATPEPEGKKTALTALELLMQG